MIRSPSMSALPKTSLAAPEYLSIERAAETRIGFLPAER